MKTWLDMLAWVLVLGLTFLVFRDLGHWCDLSPACITDRQVWRSYHRPTSRSSDDDSYLLNPTNALSPLHQVIFGSHF